RRSWWRDAISTSGRRTPESILKPRLEMATSAATRSISRHHRFAMSHSVSTLASKGESPMTNIHDIRRLTSLSRKARACAIAALTLAAGATACKKDSLLQVTDPDILNPGDYTTPAGATPLRGGVIANFTSAFDGGTDSFITM